MELDVSALDWVSLRADDLRLYGVALSLGKPLDLGALRSGAGLTPTDFDAAVARLTEAGFLSAAGATAPATALRTALHAEFARTHERLAELETAAEQIDRVSAQVTAATHAALAAHGVEYLTGAERIGTRVNELFETARREILILNAPPYAQLTTDQYDEEPAATESPAGRALARGVRVRNVLGWSGFDRPGTLDGMAELADLGLSVRVHPDVPTKLMIVDGTTALVPPSSAVDPLEHAVVLHDGLLMNALLPLFESLWGTGVPFTAVLRPSSEPGEAGHGGEPLEARRAPTDDERVLIALMASGLKDEAIARQLGVHVHTARRRITALVDHLDATTRFQAGLEAIRRGWLA